MRLVALRLLRLDALIERLHLQKELLVGDRRDLRARGDLVALLDLQRRDGAADARPRDKLMHRLDRRDHRLAVFDRRDADCRLARRRGRASMIATTATMVGAR